CLERQKEFLNYYIEEYAQYKGDVNKIDLEKYGQFYLQSEFPYIVLMKYLNILKKKAILHIYKSSTSCQDNEVIVKEVSSCIDVLKNLISKVFITKESINFRDKKQSKFQEFQLFHHHLSWVERIVNALIDDEIYNYPLVNSKECEYSNVMKYPESLMICMDASLCKELEILHELVHKESETFYRFYVRAEYLQAYFVFKEFMENVEKLLSLLKDLYYLTYSDLENSFFQLLEFLSYTDNEQILTVYDIQGVKQLNSRYGEENIDLILKKIEQIVKEEFLKNPQNSLVVRGISASFYILHLNLQDKEEFKNIIANITQKIAQMLQEEFVHYDVSSNVASFLLDAKVKYHKDELRRIMLELKNRAKESGTTLFYYTKEEQDSIRKWLNERYFSIKFLQDKIKNKEVGIMLQPIYKTKQDELFAVEALARIKDEGKLLPAGIFIDTLYEIDLVTELDMLVLDAILEKKEYILQKNIHVFINAASSSLGDARYMKKLYKFLEEFPPENIVVEITEQQALNSLDLLKEFHKKTNVQFAIDDFGTGYSALKTVSEMVEENLIAVLKMDGSLIANLDKEVQTQKIVKIITQMCETFEIYSLAEFIENEETLELLKEFNVDLSQGYFLSKPLIAEELRLL
ncbi:MAG: EAL domain-containing protein, partial [Sulfurimonas sp.]